MAATTGRLFLCAAFALVAIGCSERVEDTSAPGASPGEKLELAFITTAASDFWTFARRGTEAAVRELPGVEVDFRINDDSTSANQRRIVDDMLSRGVKGIVIGPLSPEDQAPHLAQVAEQVPLILCDSDVPRSNRSYYVGTDNVAAGREAGELVKEVLPQGGRVMLFVGKKDPQNAVDRIQGLEEAIDGAGIEVLDIRTDDVDYVRAKANVADTLIQYPDIGALVGLWSYNCPAILSALGDAGRLGEVDVVCFDEDEETLVGVRDGHVHATVVQQPYEFGYRSIKILADILGGNTGALPPGDQVIIPTLIIRQDNIESFMKKVDELLGR
jgi:ribose transport system substrate-binding protein